MTLDKDDKDRVQRLREKRSQLAEAREREEKRAKYGPQFLSKLNSVLGLRLDVGSFDERREPRVVFQRLPNFANCPGLVAAHMSEIDIRRIIKCCDNVIGQPLRGLIAFDDHRFMGNADIPPTTLGALFEAAKSLHDSVLFYPSGTASVVLIDHYRVAGVPRDVGFSVVVQGHQLETKLAACFENVIRLEDRAR